MEWQAPSGSSSSLFFVLQFYKTDISVSTSHRQMHLSAPSAAFLGRINTLVHKEGSSGVIFVGENAGHVQRAWS